MSLEPILQAIQSYHPTPDLELVKRAYLYAENAHAGQVRASGEPYMLHPSEVALLVCRLKLDLPSVAAALLHDTLEDTESEATEIEKLCGKEVAEIVEGVTKLTRIEFTSKEEEQAENFRKMLLAMAKDIRVILVKLCDRLHNMRTLQFLSEERRRRMARETQDIYAPLANRLGIHWVKSELEDLCLLHLRPEVYKLIDDNFRALGGEYDAYIAGTCEEIRKRLEEAGIAGTVQGRAKHYFSIWQKMERNNLSFEEIHDLLGFRVVVPTVRACYEALGVVHSCWKPVPGRFKDYIAMPKPNMYQSLHTTVIGSGGKRIEIQIRTPEMHRIAEEGIAAHWVYKEKRPENAVTFDLHWVRDLVDTQQYLKNPDEFIQSVKSELFPKEVFVFTPRGDLLRLPFNSTPVDFAYGVHTDVGHRTVGARVNGQQVGLDCRLRNGDTVEIVTSRTHVPSKDWLRFVQSSKARQRIRAFLKTEEHARSLALGVEMLSKDLRKVRQSLKRLEKEGRILEVAQQLGLKSEGELYAEVGYGKLSTTKVLAQVLPEESDIEEKLKTEASALDRIFKRAALVSRTKVGVRVGGFDDILVRFAKCCEPLPGDRVVGFISRGRGVTVHHADCNQALQCDPLRQVDVHWDTSVRAPRRVQLTVHSQDRKGLLMNLSQAITNHGANISTAQIKTTEQGKALNYFEIAVEDARQLQAIIRGLEMVPGVTKVERIRRPSTDFDGPDDDTPAVADDKKS